jgi:hypothetical protein
MDHRSKRHCHLQLQGGRWVLLQQGFASPLKVFGSRYEGVTYCLSFIDETGCSVTIHSAADAVPERSLDPGSTPVPVAA